MVEIKVGEFVQKHIKKIIRACIDNPTLLKNLSDVEYSKTEFGIQWKELSFLRKVPKLLSSMMIGFGKKNILLEMIVTDSFLSMEGVNR